MTLRVAMLCTLLGATLLAQKLDDEQIPLSTSPAKPEWRWGVDLGNMVILERRS